MGLSDERRATEDEPVCGGAYLGPPILGPAAILARAADVLARCGLARGTYQRQQLALQAKNSPVCTLGAIAIASGAEPHAWEDTATWTRELAAATSAIEALLNFLGLSSPVNPHETLSSWSDSHNVAIVVHVLRAASHEAARHEPNSTRSRSPG
ncbi:DUF6197 family protein [Nonomuraea wenchangensis]|uniref:DUF6197 family protein n=1 Tax=Nonomuraea wenchangensis TaxID=568860 RepID=UPI003F4CAE41